MDRDNGRRPRDELRVDRAAAALLDELDRLLEGDEPPAGDLASAVAADLASADDRRQADGRGDADAELRRDVAKHLSGGTSQETPTDNQGEPA